MPWSRPTVPGDPRYSVWLPRRLLQQKVDIGGPPAGLLFFRGTPRGWLALVGDAECPAPTLLVLWEPASGAEVPLLSLSVVAQVFLSGDPLASPH
ncbi:hypothetical protein PR202_ga07612 [Eleusine coracana subsp. coracana]|uniref:Uncharacterized protein n=1 Tax=Eleusine coracana subsp. coracana TaxID=191504 RepID=A0AAV5C0D1_ELECO|nr:hypothetical protein PR202_ga07612 [Eleusine coracana subsp. coracana]